MGKKKILVLLVVLACVLVGCGKVGDSSGDNAVNASKGTKGEKEPTVLVYGYIDAYSFSDMDSEIKKRIVQFNRSQDDYFIEIKQYGEDDYEDGLAALNAEIAAGKGPDIIQIDRASQYQEYAGKGVIVDLYPFLDADSGLQREDFVGGVLKHLEVRDKLCGLMPFFCIDSCIGNPNQLTSDNVTFEELCKMIEENEEISAFEPLSRNQLLWRCLYPGLDAFVDWENRTCDFECEEFYEIARCAGQFEEYNDMDTNELYLSMLRNEVSIVYDAQIIGFMDYACYQSLFGGDASLIGFPTVNGCKPQFSSIYSYFAINANSKEQEKAWEFIKGFVSDDFLLADSNKIMGFPITQRAFDYRAQEAMEVYVIEDENGNVIEKSASQWGITDMAGNTIWYDVYALHEEDVAYLRDIIESFEVSPDYGEIAIIISEELNTYWNGIKSIEEVAAVIQNRVTNYLQEIS